MPVIVRYAGGKKMAEVFEAVNRWSWGGGTVKFWGPGEPTAREQPLLEIVSSDIARIERAEAKVRLYRADDDPLHASQ